MGHLASDLLRGRTALITGGGSGLGLAMARTFVRLGASIVICGRSSERLQESARSLRADVDGAVIRTETCDIRDPEAVDRMMSEIHASGPIDILVNNAAATFIAETHRMSHRAVDAILNTTLHGALYCTLAAGKHWIEDGRAGVVLSILSTSTITGRAFTVPSAMAKAGLLAMTRSLAVEWGPREIRLVAIAPGSFPTLGAASQLTPSTREIFANALPFPIARHGQHDELAELAAFMVSGGCSYMNGEMVVLDGGAHLRTSGAEDLLNWSAKQWQDHRDSVRKS